MLFRMIGSVVTFAIILYFIGSFLSSDNDEKKAINANPTVQEQQKALKDQGVDATDQKALEKYTMDQAKKLQEYQNSAPPPQQ